MSTIQSIKQVLGISGTASENHFWDGSVPNQLSLKRGTPDAPGAELIKALNGALSFPNQGQSLAPDGYVKLPGGLIIQWGFNNNTAAGGVPLVTFPITFPNAILAADVQVIAPSGTEYGFCSTSGLATSGMYVQTRSADGVLIPINFNWIAIGH